MKPRGNNKLIKIGVAIAALVVTLNNVACAPLEAFGTGDGEGSFGSLAQASLEGFKAQGSVYNLVAARCASCHAGAVAPFFAASDVNIAHQFAASKVNLSAPDQSRLVQRLGNERHNCWSADCAADAAAMRAAVEVWAKVVRDLTDHRTDARVNLAATVIPAPLPTGTNWTTLRWNLSAIGAADAEFSIEIQEFQSEYRVRNPTITTPTRNIQVKDVRFRVNNSIRDNETTYSLVDTTLNASPTAQVLSNVTMIMVKTNGPGVDQIAPSFMTLRTIAQPPGI